MTCSTIAALAAGGWPTIQNLDLDLDLGLNLEHLFRPDLPCSTAVALLVELVSLSMAR
jgi:hypothetical protein